MACARLFPLRILGRKWSYLVLRALLEPMRFSDLKDELHFVTNRVLAHELKQLETENLIARGEEYRLTPAGKALVDAVEPLVAWSVLHRNLRYCPPSLKCSRCASYREQVDPALLKIGNRTA